MEPLEKRNLLSAFLNIGPVQPLTDAPPSEVVGQAILLDPSGTTAPSAAASNLGNGSAGAADVAWYTFTLTSASHVTVATSAPRAGSPLVSVLSLYDTDPYNFNPPYGTTSGYRLLAQNAGTALQPNTAVQRDLAPGTYYVAVSGAGNLYFNPLLADSGAAGSTGAYQLQLTATDLGIPAGDGPIILGGDPSPSTPADHSPVVIRVDLSAPLNVDTINLNQTTNPIPLDPFEPQPTDANGNPLPYVPTVWLEGSSTSDFSNAVTPILLSGGDVSFSASELRVSPATPLLPGYYRLHLAGDSSQHTFFIADANGNPLGYDPNNSPTGQDLTFTFQVAGIEGRTGPDATTDDTIATAHELGDVTQLVQVAGTIGDNPNFTGGNAGANVNLYHFHVAGPGRYALAADAFAGRIGSPLDVGVSLFQLDPVDHQTLHLITANDNTLNSLLPDGALTPPLATDAALYAGLTAGDYYLVVSAGGNVPDPSLGLAPGVNGIFDLNAGTSYSGPNTLSTGDYVLSVILEPAGAPPQVTVTSLADGSTLPAPPMQLSVQFSAPVNLQQLAYTTFQTAPASQSGASFNLGAVFIAGPGGPYYPRLETYDRTASVADFTLLAPLPAGAYELHLSGAHGLTDFAGNPLVGNDPSGDYVVHFTVLPPSLGPAGAAQGPAALFPSQLQAGITLAGNFSQTVKTSAAGSGDQYPVQFGETQTYLFNLTGNQLPAGVVPEIFRGSTIQPGQQPLLTLTQGSNAAAVTLGRGTYVIFIPHFSADPNPAYTLTLSIQQVPDNPTPLTIGPEPAFRLRLTTAPSTAPNPATTRLVLSVPATTSSSTTTTVATAPSGHTSGGTPTSVLLALTAGPIGGVSGTTLDVTAAGPDRLLVSGPALVVREHILQVAILTGVDGAGSSNAPATDNDTVADRTLVQLKPLLREYAVKAMKSWQELLDMLFANDPGTGEEDPAPVSEPMKQDAPESMPVLPDALETSAQPEQDASFNWPAAGVLVGLGALREALPERQRSRPVRSPERPRRGS